MSERASRSFLSVLFQKEIEKEEEKELAISTCLVSLYNEQLLIHLNQLNTYF